MTWNPERFDRAMAEIKKRAAHDPAFRALALKDPTAAVRLVTGEDQPGVLPLRFIESPGIHTVVLPDYLGTDPLA